MKIVVPINDLDNYEILQDAGTDEFYCGFVPYEWVEKYNITLPLNRREWFIGGHNINSWDTMKILREKVEKRGTPVKITLNSRFYVPEQYSLICEIVGRLMEIGYDTLIMTDIGLLSYLRRQGIDCNIHLSGVAGIRNHLSLKLLDDLNIKRIVFPRKTLIKEIAEVIKSRPDLEYEVFTLNERCLASEEYCNSLLCDKLFSVCTLPNKLCWLDDQKFSAQKAFFKKFQKLKVVNYENILKNDTRLGVRGCGLCMIQELKTAGVTHLKVVGRMLESEKIIEDVSTVKRLIEMADTTDNYEVDVRKEYFNNKCPEACYFLKS